jgi:hypothetical protein
VHQRLPFQFQQSGIHHLVALCRIRDLASGMNYRSNDISASNNAHQFMVANDGQSFDVVFSDQAPSLFERSRLGKPLILWSSISRAAAKIEVSGVTVTT